jgi:hypothetical protein
MTLPDRRIRQVSLGKPSKPGALLITAQPGQTILIHLSKLIEIVEQNSQKSSKFEQTSE